jgi:hypothetical protein
VRRAVRFFWVALLAAIAIPCLGHLFLPGVFDTGDRADPADPAEIAVGVIVWLLVFAIATLDLLIGNRKGAALRDRPDGRLCPACGYDLRATPDRCPECGRVPRDGGAE